MQTIFAFDVGLGSLGEAVRIGNEIVHADSMLIDADVGDVSKEANRRRQFRTRQTHQEREKVWENLWLSIGKEPLKGAHEENGIWVKGDERLEREFAADEDETLYTSCLLRIALIEGQPLEDWQIYKAIRSAFMRAGYPEALPWAKRQQEKDDREVTERVGAFHEMLSDTFRDAKHRLPCYLDAYKMGLFDPRTGKIERQQSHHAERARGYTPDRATVERELRALLEEAAKQVPELRSYVAEQCKDAARWIDYVLYGPSLKPFDDTRIDGILDQKIARFDNRCVKNCCLMPRFHVCRAADTLYFQTHFLLKLRNMIVEDGEINRKLHTSEILEWYESKEAKRKKYIYECQTLSQHIDMGKIARFYKITKTEWGKWSAANGLAIQPNACNVPPPRADGRTGFCRPALAILRELILSGKPPHDFRAELIAQNFQRFAKFKLNEDDLDFLLAMKENNSTAIYISPKSLAERFIDADGDVDAGIANVIGSTRDSKIRHRLTVFANRLKELTAAYGQPDGVVIEFTREDFANKDAKKRYDDAAKNNQKLYEKAKKALQEAGIDYHTQTDHLVKKYMLWEKQGNACVYTGNAISWAHLISSCEIEHIIPQCDKYNGPDAIENIVVTLREINDRKGDRLPWECPEIIGDMKAYKARVEASSLSNKTKNILLCKNKEEADALIERYYGLAFTGWTARLARDIACIWFGWQPGAEGESRKLHVVSGSLVGKMRKKYHLNDVLNPTAVEARSKETDDDSPAVETKKNREDDRHHALDAMVMTYLEEYARNIRNFDLLKLPEGVNAEYFAKKLEELHIVPHKIARAKARLGETAYRVVTQKRIELKRGKPVEVNEEILVSTKRVNEITKVQDSHNILDPVIRSRFEEFFRTHPKPSAEEMSAFAENLRVSPDGPRVKKVKVRAGSPDNVKNLSKIPDARHGSYYMSMSEMGKGTRQHGMYLYGKGDGKWKVKPVYAFESPYKAKEKLMNSGYAIKDDALFYAGCIIEVTRPVPEKDIDAGSYKVASIWSSGQIKVENLKGEQQLFALSSLDDAFHFVQ